MNPNCCCNYDPPTLRCSPCQRLDHDHCDDIMHAHRERARASEAELQRREVAKQMGEKAAQIASTTHLSYDEAMSGLMMAYNGVNMETIPKKMAAEFAALLCFCGFFLGVIVMLLIWHPWT